MPDYYILGSKWKRDGDWQNRLPDMISRNLLEVGWSGDCGSFEDLYGQPETEIVNHLKKLRQHPRSCHAHKLFLNMVPGDLVAIKTDGAPKGSEPNLTVQAYARVTEKNGVAYSYRKKDAAHCINAKFLLHGKEYRFPLGYGGTLHRLSHPSHIRQVFAPVLRPKTALGIMQPGERIRWHRKAALLKAVEKQIRHSDEKTISIQQKHHLIRNKLYKKLIKEHGEENVFMELDCVDLQVRTAKARILYEVKPYGSVIYCIRAALGQILSYAWTESEKNAGGMQLIVVGPSAPNKEDQDFIRFVRSCLKVKFEYLCFS